MRTTLVTVLLLFLANSHAEVLFERVSVVTMNGDEVLGERWVLVEDDRIRRISVERPTVEGDVEVIDGRGLFLMPGLAEMHAHIPPSGTRKAMEDVLFLFLSQGVTTVRGMLGEPGHIAAREAAAAGELASPRILTSGPSFNGNSVTSPEQARSRVRDQVAEGYDLLKLHPGLSREEFTAIMDEARAQGIRTAGHVSADYDVWYAIEQGQDCIDHLDRFVSALVPADDPGQPGAFFGVDLARKANRSLVDDVARRVADAGTWLVPTEALMARFLGDRETEDLLADPGMNYMPRSTRSQWAGQRAGLPFDAADRAAFLEIRLTLIGALHEAGARLLLGSDAPQVFNVPGFSIHQELALYVAAGLTPREALETGTVRVAEYLGREDAGRVVEGHLADLVLLGANPVEDIAATRDIRGVMVGGRWHSRARIDERLAAIAK